MMRFMLLGVLSVAVAVTCLMRVAEGVEASKSPSSHIVIRHIGEQDKSIPLGVVATSEDEREKQCGSRYRTCSFVVLSRSDFNQILDYVRGNPGSPDAGDPGSWHRGYAPPFGTFEVRWNDSGGEDRRIVRSSLTCSYFDGIARIPAARASPPLMKYLLKVRRYARCGDLDSRAQ
jgi:hypothetical protein